MIAAVGLVAYGRVIEAEELVDRFAGALLRDGGADLKADRMVREAGRQVWSAELRLSGAERPRCREPARRL